MKKDDKKKKFISEIIFEELKDKFEVNTTSHLRYYLNDKKIELNNDEIRELYVKLTNYRIEKYGNSVVFKEFPNVKKYISYDEYIKKLKKKK